MMMMAPAWKMKTEMKLRLAFVTLAALTTFIGLGGVAQAKIYASGPLYAAGGPVGGQFVCRIFNAGSTSATITSRQIFTNTNVSMALTSDTCTVALGSTQYCAFITTIVGNLAHSCRLNAVGSGLVIRGTAQVQSGPTVLNTTPMQ